MRSSPIWGGILLCALVSVAGCTSQAGPAALEPGTYSALASSTGSHPFSTELTVTSDGVSVRSATSTGPAAFAGPSDEYLLCPPRGRGSGTTLNGPITVEGHTYHRPMVFGDCGTTRPLRLTLVDLDTTLAPEQSTAVPFGRWIEFCRRGDPDCPRP